ncbi:MAG: hypothetical protein A2270_03095 [Elusimicrobia bacterium RIFOXYA12_FULL_51_18]|nr:MAG: hypothetical protein A2270_03095 [Elusimicrobia bacterium RIFOXYA12_FULL_51_18]OGS30800.1 MAG: hypothetical protein A2218_08420 [Elusimicrobia bacterium RIFOXYA2_FULL_53_38]
MFKVAASLITNFMLTKGDIADVISEYLLRGPRSCAGAVTAKASRPLPKRVFISDWELKKLVKPGQKAVKVSAADIISPLSMDWLDYNGIEVIRE